MASVKTQSILQVLRRSIRLCGFSNMILPKANLDNFGIDFEAAQELWNDENAIEAEAKPKGETSGRQFAD